MLTQQDLQQIAAKGIAEEQLQKQMDDFKRGFPFLRLDSAATVGHGILAPTDAEREEYIRQWDAYKAGKHRVTKFVPASGAASRMFKNLFAFLDADYDAPQTSFEHEFFDHIHQFAFFSELDAACLKNEGKGIDDLLAAGGHKAVVANLLEDGVFEGGAIWEADMASGYVKLGYGDETMTQQVSDELKAEVEDIKTKIISGEIEVPTVRNLAE